MYPYQCAFADCTDARKPYLAQNVFQWQRSESDLIQIQGRHASFNGHCWEQLLETAGSHSRSHANAGLLYR